MSTFNPSDYKQLPKSTGVYQFFNDADTLLYVGKALNLRKRVSDYFEQRTHSPRIAQMVPHIKKIMITLTISEQDALLLEQRLIQSLKPKYNIIFRDDKTYSYLCFNAHPFPKIYLYKDKKKPQDMHFGPFTDQFSLSTTFETLQKYFLLRSCSDADFKNRVRPCVLYQTQHCSAPCVNKISKEDYALNVKRATDFLKGESKPLIESLQTQMHQAAQELHFEKAIALRNQIHSLSALLQDSRLEQGSHFNLDIVGAFQTEENTHLHILRMHKGILQASFPLTVNAQEDLEHVLEMLLQHLYSSENCSNENATLLLSSAFSNAPLDNIIKPANVALAFKVENDDQQRLLSMAEQNAKYASVNTFKGISLAQKQIDLEKLIGQSPLNHIECFDISHFNAESAVAACVVYKHGKMEQKDYRIYNIEQKIAGDDYASMANAVARRYQNMPKEEFPDLILLDGGLGQLHAVQHIFSHLQLQIPLLAISKGRARKVGDEKLYYQTNEEPITPGIHSAALQLLAHIRDEAHRFGIERNRKLVSNKRLSSLWDNIPGVGEKKKEALKLAFKNTANLRKASPEQLQQVPGISPTLARSIHLFLQALP